jgi:hypothetical protein
MARYLLAIVATKRAEWKRGGRETTVFAAAFTLARMDTDGRQQAATQTSEGFGWEPRGAFYPENIIKVKPKLRNHNRMLERKNIIRRKSRAGVAAATHHDHEAVY